MTRWLRILPLLVLIFVCQVQAQTAKERVDAGHQAYLKGNFDRALEAYADALKMEPRNFDAHFFSGVIFYARKNYAEALPWLEKAREINAKGNDALGFYLGECHFFQERYGQAIPFYEAFAGASHPDIDMVQRARDQLRNARFAVEALKQPVPKHSSPDWLSAINSDYDDFNPWLTGEDSLLVFSTQRVSGLDYSLMFCRWKNDRFTQPEILSPPAGTPDDESECSITADGGTLVFTHATYCPPQTNCRKSYRFKTSYRAREGWSVPKSLPESVLMHPAGPDDKSGRSEVYDETFANPALSPDGKQLFFSSKRPGGMGGFDLWRSEMTDTGWAAPKNLGPTVNTPGDEADPCLLADGQTLVFSTNGHAGFGGYDFFATRRLGQGWQTPRNLGKPFNTAEDEFDLFVSKGGRRYWFNRDLPSKRWPETTQRDLFLIELEESPTWWNDWGR